MFCLPLQKLIPSLASLLMAGQVMAQSFERTDSDTDSLSKYIQMKFGLDQELYNGFQNYNRYALYKGHPYFPDDLFFKGSVTLRGIQHQDVRLKYDIYSQFLILEYSDFEESVHQVIISKIHTDSFQLGNHSFHKLSLTGEEPIFCQVLNSGPLTCYVHWKKEVVSVSYDFQHSHEFTGSMRKYYLRYHGQVYSFASRKSFISIFPDTLTPVLKKYFRQQQFSFRDADPADLQSLLDFISRYIETLSLP